MTNFVSWILTKYEKILRTGKNLPPLVRSVLARNEVKTSQRFYWIGKFRKENSVGTSYNDK